MSDRPSPGRARALFLGSGAFGIPSLRRLAAATDVDLVGVVTAPARPVGRRQEITPTPIESAARELGIATLLTPARLRAPEAIADALALEPGLAVLADYGQLVPPALLALEHRALNLHPSLLPRHRGATPIPAAILAGDAETGVSLMVMDKGLDTGPIVGREVVALDGTETGPGLEARLADVAAGLLGRSLGPWLRGELAAVPQPSEDANLTRPLRREDGRLDPSRSAVELERQVRAYQPWPGSFLETRDGRLVVWRATVGDTNGVDGDRPPVGILGVSGLATADGRLELLEVQPAGGRRMAWAEYVRGRPSVVGSSVQTD